MWLPPKFTLFYSLIDKILRREPEDRIKIDQIMKHPWLMDISNDVYEQKTAKHRSFQKLPAAREHDKICEHIKSLASLDEINEALRAQKFNNLTGITFLIENSFTTLFQLLIFFLLRSCTEQEIIEDQRDQPLGLRIFHQYRHYLLAQGILFDPLLKSNVKLDPPPQPRVPRPRDHRVTLRAKYPLVPRSHASIWRLPRERGPWRARVSFFSFTADGWSNFKICSRLWLSI